MISSRSASAKYIFRGPFFWLFCTRLLLAFALTSIGGAAFAYGFPMFGAIAELCAGVIAVSVVVKILQATGLDKAPVLSTVSITLEKEGSAIDTEAALLADVARSSHRGVVLLDAAGKVVWTNALAAQYLRVFPEALAHFNWDDLHNNFHPRHRAQLLELLMVDAQPSTLEMELADDSHGVWVDVDIAKTTSGGWALLVADVSNRKHAQEDLAARESRMRAIHDALPTGLFVSDNDGMVIECNDQATNMLEVPKDRCLGRRIDDAHAWLVTGTDGTPMEAEHLASGIVLRKKESVFNQTLYVATPLSEKVMSFSAASINHPDLGVVLTMFDISTTPVMNEHEQALRNLHILVVDDNAISLQIAQELLIKEGARVSAISAGEHVLDYLSTALEQTALPDAIMLDTQMPGMDGYATINAIRSRPEFASLPVLAMSTSPQERFGWSGATQFNGDLHKPLNASTVVPSLLRCILDVSKDIGESSNDPGNSVAS